MTNFIIISSCDVTQQRESPSAVIVPFILCLLFGLPLKLWDKCLKKWCNSLSKALEAWTKQWREHATCNLCTRESWRRHSVIVFCFLSKITVVIRLKCRTQAYEVFNSLFFWRQLGLKSDTSDSPSPMAVHHSDICSNPEMAFRLNIWNPGLWLCLKD